MELGFAENDEDRGLIFYSVNPIKFIAHFNPSHLLVFPISPFHVPSCSRAIL